MQMQVEISEQTEQRKLRRYAISALAMVNHEIIGNEMTFVSWDGTERHLVEIRDAWASELAKDLGWESDKFELVITSFAHCWGEDGEVNE